MTEITPQSFTRESLSPGQREEMFTLLAQHFEGVTREQFERDLTDKSHVILLHRENQLAGFSTMLAYESWFNGETVGVIYSGDTIVSPESWSSAILSRTWISTVNELRANTPHEKYYWLLLTSGFRTYRFLPVFWREFFPRVGPPTPGEQKQLLDHLAAERFGEEYDPHSGLVRFTRPQKLRGNLADIPEGRASNPHIAFFLKRNPDWRDGDELACLTELSPANLTPAGRRMVASPVREPDCCHR